MAGDFNLPVTAHGHDVQKMCDTQRYRGQIYEAEVPASPDLYPESLVVSYSVVYRMQIGFHWSGFGFWLPTVIAQEKEKWLLHAIGHCTTQWSAVNIDSCPALLVVVTKLERSSAPQRMAKDPHVR